MVLVRLFGFIHKLRWFSEPDAKNGAGSPCATAHAGHYICPEVVPTTVTLERVRLYTSKKNQNYIEIFLNYRSKSGILLELGLWGDLGLRSGTMRGHSGSWLGVGDP